MTETPTAPHLESAGPISRFLWFCAGADASLLVQCPHSDRVKYQGIGGIVLATAVLAFTSGSYAFYAVFCPKDQTVLSQDIHLPTVLQSMAAGLVWSLIIFNIDRFIVSSTGKSDGSDTITWNQFSKAIPRIIMALIIGVCISAPLEIRILKPEIEAQLELEQNEYLQRLNAHSDRLIEARREELRKRVQDQGTAPAARARGRRADRQQTRGTGTCLAGQARHPRQDGAGARDRSRARQGEAGAARG